MYFFLIVVNIKHSLVLFSRYVPHLYKQFKLFFKKESTLERYSDYLRMSYRNSKADLNLTMVNYTRQYVFF